MIEENPDLKSKIDVVTPTISLSGIAGNFDIDASKTFRGTGVEPWAYERMKRWDEHRVSGRRIFPDSGLADRDETRGVVGVGLARVLGLCGPLRLRDCPPRPATVAPKPSAPAPALVNVADLEPAAERRGASPRLDLLAATAAGAPNVVSLFVSRAEPQAARELDD